MRRLPFLAAVLTAAALGGCGADTRPRGESSAASSASTLSLTATAPTAASTTTRENRQMRITISVGGTTLTGALDDNAASRDLFARLPVEIAMTDHGGVEKTGPFPAPLSLDGLPRGADPEVGDIGYYAPSQDFVLYYGDQTYYEGIVVLGRIDNGVEVLANVGGDIRVVMSSTS